MKNLDNASANVLYISLKNLIKNSNCLTIRSHLARRVEGHAKFFNHNDMFSKWTCARRVTPWNAPWRIQWPVLSRQSRSYVVSRLVFLNKSDRSTVLHFVYLAQNRTFIASVGVDDELLYKVWNNEVWNNVWPFSDSSSVVVVRYLFNLSDANIPALDNTTGYLSLIFFQVLIVLPFASLALVAS